ncbi:hypothetical protein CCP2SC5_2150003 [Azospirillaceae bacterium]
METILGVADFAMVHFEAIVTFAFATIGVLSQAAALFNLSGLAKISATLHDVVQIMAGNWGRATNLIKVVKIYHTDGPLAALEALKNLAETAPPGAVS